MEILRNIGIDSNIVTVKHIIEKYENIKYNILPLEKIVYALAINVLVNVVANERTFSKLNYSS